MKLEKVNEFQHRHNVFGYVVYPNIKNRCNVQSVCTDLPFLTLNPPLVQAFHTRVPARQENGYLKPGLSVLHLNDGSLIPPSWMFILMCVAGEFGFTMHVDV